MRGIAWRVLLGASVLLASAPAAATPGVVLAVQRDADGVRRAVVENRLAGPLQVRVWAGDRGGTAAEAVLAAGETRVLGRFAGDGGTDLRLHAVPGAPLLVPPEQRRVYAFPLPADADWRLTQGFGGRASHRAPAHWHALDLAAPIGTPVLAAREGTVMEVIDHFTEGGTDASLKERANLVRVLHADGTMAVYAHIATGSARVRPGEGVAAGQTLAAVGNVGWSTAPHLHFVVQANVGETLLSLPFRMPSLAGAAVVDGTAARP